MIYITYLEVQFQLQVDPLRLFFQGYIPTGELTMVFSP